MRGTATTLIRIHARRIHRDPVAPPAARGCARPARTRADAEHT